jgi:serine/threonine protein kinase
MNCLFTHEIYDWPSWGRVFQSIEAWRALIRYIYQKEKLPYAEIESCTPGTNAVFKVGRFIVKIFAPKESGMDTDSDYDTERFGLERAGLLGIHAPRLIASGDVQDKYLFRYLVMDYIDGISFNKIEKTLSYEEKVAVGQKLRAITDKMNTPCARFNAIDVVDRAICSTRWTAFPAEFNRERLAYLEKLHMDESEKVFVHGDLNPDNILLDADKELYIIDFADAVLAPVSCELALTTSELFCFEKPFMQGFFGDYTAEDIAELCINGLLIHDYGAGILRASLGSADGISSLEILRERLIWLIKAEKEK